MQLNISLLFITILLIGCSDSLDKEYEKINIKFSDYFLYYKPDGYCEQEVYERIYEDKINIYYMYTNGCDINGEYYFIKYNDEYVTIRRAIDENIISINDVSESIKLFIVEKK